MGKKLETETEPSYAGATVANQPKRIGTVLGTDLPYRKMSDLEGKECVVHDLTLHRHPEFGDAYKATITVEGGKEMCCTFLRGTAILNKLQELDKSLLPLAFRLFKPEGKRYWDIE